MRRTGASAGSATSRVSTQPQRARAAASAGDRRLTRRRNAAPAPALWLEWESGHASSPPAVDDVDDDDAGDDDDGGGAESALMATQWRANCANRTAIEFALLRLLSVLQLSLFFEGLTAIGAKSSA